MKPHTISTYQCIYEDEDLIEERLLSISRLNDEGKVLQREEYDEEGNLIKNEEFQYQEELVTLSSEEDFLEKRRTKTLYEYRDKLVVNQKDYFDEILSHETNYKYNEQGQLIENEILNSDGSLNSKYTYEYADQKTTERFYDEEMTMVRMTETVKDDNGQIIEKKITEVYEDREVVMSQKVEYNVTDNESSRNYYNNGVEIYEIIEVLDEEGKVHEKIAYDVEKDEESVTTLEYDDQGQLIKEEISVDEEVVSIANIEFDEYNNRVKLEKYTKLADDFFDTTTYKFVNEYNIEKSD